jgi:CheY-like chemotaxis protein
MQDRVTTSWRRLSDQTTNHADSASSRGARTSPRHVMEAQPLEVWEDEGGKTGLSCEPVRVLIVDNDMSSADSLELMLHAFGHSQTRVAYSGHAALAIGAEFRPDVVLLEINLLDMSGYDVAQSLREQAQNRDLRLIALTSSREHAGRELARVAGFERYLLKPVSAIEMSELVRTRSL